MKVKICTQGKNGSLNINADGENVEFSIKSGDSEISAEMSMTELRHHYLTGTGKIPRKVDPPPFFTDNVRNPGVEQ